MNKIAVVCLLVVGLLAVGCYTPGVWSYETGRSLDRTYRPDPNSSDIENLDTYYTQVHINLNPEGVSSSTHWRADSNSYSISRKSLGTKHNGYGQTRYILVFTKNGKDTVIDGDNLFTPDTGREISVWRESDKKIHVIYIQNLRHHPHVEYAVTENGGITWNTEEIDSSLRPSRPSFLSNGFIRVLDKKTDKWRTYTRQ